VAIVRRGGARCWAVAAIAMAMSAGCYESEFPLDASPQLEVEEAWLGTWRCLPMAADVDEQPATLRVKRGGDRRYDATWQEGDKAPERYEGFTSAVRDARFVNIRERKADGTMGQWAFVRPTLLRPSVLQLQVVADDAMRTVEASAAALRRAVEQKVSTSALTVDFCVCVRATEPPEPTPRP
jgi:hypothetical protein